MTASSKKIEVLVDHFYPATGGLAIHCLRVYGILCKRGWQIRVQTTKNTIEKKNILPDHDRVAEIDVCRYSFENYNFNPWALKINYNNCGVICLNELIIFPHYFVYFYSYVLNFFKHKKFAVVLTSHGLFTTNIEAYKSIRRKIKRFIDRSLGVFLINRTVDRIHSISQTEKNGLISAGVKPDLIEVIPNGIDEEAFMDAEHLASEKVKNLVLGWGNYLLQVGRLDRHKNYEAAINALVFLPESFKLVILGPEEDRLYKNELLKLIQNLGLTGRVIFAGTIKGVDKFYIMKHALAYIHMAHSEGFGMVVQEAMSQGTVCLVSKGTGLEELIKDGVNGYVLPKDDFKKIAERIKFISENFNSQEIIRMKENNIASVKTRKWDKVADSIENLFEKAIMHNQNSL